MNQRTNSKETNRVWTSAVVATASLALVACSTTNFSTQASGEAAAYANYAGNPEGTDEYTNYAGNSAGTDRYVNFRNPWPAHGTIHTNYSEAPRYEAVKSQGVPAGALASEAEWSEEPQEVARIESGKIVITERIVFASWSAKIDPRSTDVLSKVAELLRENPQINRVEIQGHTARMGMPEAMEELSQKRAAAVRERLIADGVHGDRLIARGYGEERPLSNVHVDEDRRVEFVILQKKLASLY